MRKQILLLGLCLHLLSLPLTAVDMHFRDHSQQVIIDNRVLAKVNGKVISVMDVMKKMDVVFFREYPQYALLPEVRFQFYQMTWKQVLEELINKELIMAEAEELKVEVSNGDVRQEMEDIFGPNIIASLDQIKITYEEAAKMIRSELVLKRMLGIRTQLKAMKKVTPRVIRTAYQEFAKANYRPEQWIYRVISIRDKDPILAEKSAQDVYRLLVDDGVAIGQLAERVKTEGDIPDNSQVTVSEEYTHEEKEMSAAYKEVLTQLQSGHYSPPKIQKSRADSSQVFRIFFLKEFKPGGVPSFDEVANEIKDALIEQEAEKETTAYFKRLRKHFDINEKIVEEMLADGFEPFKLA